MIETNSDQPIINILGDRLALGPLRRDLVPTYCRWLNDPVTLRAYRMLVPFGEEQTLQWYERHSTGTDLTHFTIYTQEGWRPIGWTGLDKIDHRSRKAEFDILIGEANCRGKGYGTETARLVLDFGFVALGLHNIMLEVTEFNQAGIRAYGKAGFREFGRRHQCYLMGDRLWDKIYMECLATNWKSPVLDRIFVQDES